jgi:hypothetical protein
MHYLKLAWSHGQANLVRGGFVEAMKFVDDARARKEGVLIQYVSILLIQCSILNIFTAANVVSRVLPPW